MVQMFGWSNDEARRASRSNRLRLACFRAELGRDDFDHNRAAKLCVDGFVNCSLPADTELVRDAIVAKGLAYHVIRVHLRKSLDQFVRSGGRRTDFSDDDSGGVISQCRGFEHRCACSECAGQSGDDGVAGAGDIIDLARCCFDVNRLAVAFQQHHSTIAARY